MDKEKMNNDPQNTSEEITERIEEMIEEETETGAGTVSISDRLREAEADENDYDADVEDGYDEAEYDEADGEVDGENEYGDASEDAEYVEDEYSEEEEEEDDDDEPRIVVNPKVVKVASLILFSGIILVFASIAWFTMNKEVGTGGMSIKSQSSLFELRTTGSSGIYDDYITRVDAEYTDDSETGSNSKIIWQLTKGNTDSTVTQGNINNLYLGSGTPSADEMKEFKKLESSKYGLSPGDYGTLSFIIVPKVDSVDTTVKVSVKCYKTEYYLSGEDIGYQKDVFEPMDDEDADEAKAIQFTNTHIMFFYKDSSNHLHMLTDDGFDELSITENRNVTLYWVWPEKLKNILELNVAGLDTTGATELRAYMLKNPELFLAKNSEDSSTVFDGIKLSEDATESDIQAKATAILATNTSYNPWGARYNNADQIIGDYVGYIMVEGIVDSKDDNQ